MDQFKIRFATSGDEFNIAKIHVESWKTTYSEIVSQNYLDELSLEKRTLMWKEVIKSSRTDGQTIVSEFNKQIVGFIDVGISRSPDLFKNFGEIYALYLAKDFQKMGIGKKLFLEGARWLILQNFTSMFLRVIKNNPTRNFYEHMGGKVHSSKIEHIGDLEIEEISIIWKDLSVFNDESYESMK